jgi:hypothetical protein
MALSVAPAGIGSMLTPLGFQLDALLPASFLLPAVNHRISFGEMPYSFSRIPRPHHGGKHVFGTDRFPSVSRFVDVEPTLV